MGLLEKRINAFLKAAKDLSVTRKDALAFLELEHPFSDNELRRAYKVAAMKHHPDRGGSNDSMIKANLSFQKLLPLVGMSENAAKVYGGEKGEKREPPKPPEQPKPEAGSIRNNAGIRHLAHKKALSNKWAAPLHGVSDTKRVYKQTFNWVLQQAGLPMEWPDVGAVDWDEKFEEISLRKKHPKRPW